MSVSVKQRIWVSARRLAADRRGAVLPLFAVALVLIVVAAGAGIDFARAVNERQALARGLDAAMLAVARELSTRNLSQAEIKAYLEDNYEAYFGANTAGSASFGDKIVIDEPVIDTAARTISVSASTRVPTSFIRLAGAGLEEIEVGVSAQAIYPKSVEATLVLDVTGSMGGSKIAALRDAATDFVNTLVPPETADANEKIRISVVPYATGVNVGEARATAATRGANATRTSFRYCVSERTGAQAYTDASYVTAAVGPGTVQAGYKSGYYKSGNRALSRRSMLCPDAEVVPLTLEPGPASKAGTPLHTISRLAADGQTVGQAGIAWGWYTLSENWSSLWPAASRPAPYSDERVLKYMVLMTDGEFNTYFDGPVRIRGSWYDWIVQLSTWQSTNRATKLCDAIKKSGITIITVGFQIGGNSNAKKVMNDCASTPEDFYLADNDEELIAEFRKIANQIKATFLSQ